ncbi:PhnA domain-containing protein [Gillisia sp. M10.2A]|uniref:PhnA domain-containing protein n=1 Tax=Gillisia lutea TaxID=2909668 RepID=A0ABS9ED66_9FLAO|nr:alkylphosphonate utilization protein [Gillisia lutea]MCF4100827.1 PhnA domain-containing protein [Gillisia lutea]
MSLEQELMQRSGSQCELCASKENLEIFEIPDSPANVENSILVCETCKEQIEDPEKVVPSHWRCLNDSMWSTVPAVQVMAWRMLTQLKNEGWPQDLLDMMYMEEEVMEWAKASQIADPAAKSIVHRDSNGVILEAGDSVVLIKDLKVKGSSMVAKQGTAVRRISLDHENEEYIEGKVDGQQIVIITKYVKKL